MSIKRDKRPLMAIMRRHQANDRPKGVWSVILTLSCGHKIRRKSGSSPKYRARCVECYLEAETRG